MPAQLYLLRISGEISTKSAGTRVHFTRRLARNLRDAFASAGLDHRLERRWSRLYLECADPRAPELLARVFGVHSFSPVEVRPWSGLDDLVAAGEELFAEAVAGKTFAVRARRSGDKGKVAVSSLEVERELGTALLRHARKVDLSHPEVTASVEMHSDRVYFFTGKLPGADGLPLGVEGRALALVSGGFDSAVAAWMMLRRGVALDYLHFLLGGPAGERELLAILRRLAEGWSHGDRPRLHLVDFRPLVAELGEKVPSRLRQVVLKRLMLRAGETVARQHGRCGLVTGEAIGQVSSQTPQNLAAISHSIEALVFRPLLGFNKEEIMERARLLGTYELSAAVPEHCALVPRQPATRATRGAVDRGEAVLDPAYLERAVADRRVLELRRPETYETPTEDLGVDELPPGAVVLDLRPAAAHQAWHPPGARRVELFDALARAASLPPGETYLALCALGLKSAHLADALRRAGHRAFYLRREAYERLRREGAADPLLDQLLAPALLDR